MNEQARMALPVLLPAMGIAAVMLLAAWQPWRRNPPVQQAHWSVPLALAAAFVTAFLVLTGEKGLHLRERWHLIAPMTLAAMGLGMVAAFWRAAPARILIALATAAAAGLLLSPPAIIQQPLAWRIGLGAAVLALWGSLEPLAVRRPGASLPLATTIVFAGVSMLLLQAHQAMLSLLAASMSAASGVALVIALLQRNLSYARGGTNVVATTLAALLVIGWCYNRDLPALPFALVLIAPAALWIGELKLVANRQPWLAVGLRAAFVLIVVAIALLLALRASSGDESDYYAY